MELAKNLTNNPLERLILVQEDKEEWYKFKWIILVIRQVLFCTYGFQIKIKILSYDLLLFSAWFIEKEFDLSVKIVTKIDSIDKNSDVPHFFMSHRLGFSGSQTKFWNVRNANIQRRLFGIIGFQ